jgi:hypothetical protein
MIERFNHSMKLKAAAYFAGGIVCLFLTWLIFLWLPGYVAGVLGYIWPRWLSHLVALGLTALVFYLGWRRAEQGGELQDYGDTAIYENLQPHSMGAYVTGLNRAAGGTYLLTQLVLGAPLGIYRSRVLLASRIPDSVDLEGRLRRVLARLREANKWEPLSAYPDIQAEIRYLARMDMISFSERHSEARLKASPPDGI